MTDLYVTEAHITMTLSNGAQVVAFIDSDGTVRRYAGPTEHLEAAAPATDAMAEAIAAAAAEHNEGDTND